MSNHGSRNLKAKHWGAKWIRYGFVRDFRFSMEKDDSGYIGGNQIWQGKCGADLFRKCRGAFLRSQNCKDLCWHKKKLRFSTRMRTSTPLEKLPRSFTLPNIVHEE